MEMFDESVAPIHSKCSQRPYVRTAGCTKAWCRSCGACEVHCNCDETEYVSEEVEETAQVAFRARNFFRTLVPTTQAPAAMPT